MKKRNTKIRNHNYIYDIINFWLSDEKNEYYIFSLIENVDEVFDLIYPTLIELVMDRFCDSCRKELINQEQDIVDKNYYVKIFNKIYNDIRYDHKFDKVIENKIEDLLFDVKYKKCNEDNKTSIYDAISNLTKEDKKIKELHLVTKTQLENQMKYFEEYYFDIINSRERENFKSNDTTIIGDNDFNQYAYTIEKGLNGITTLYIHVLDADSLIPEGTPVYFDMRNNNAINKDLLKLILLRDKVISPTITYEISIDKMGNIINFTFYTSIIKPNSILSKSLSCKKEKNSMQIKKFFDLYELLNRSNTKKKEVDKIGEVDNYFVDTLNNLLNNYVSSNNIPCIYKVQEAPNMEEFAEQVNNLNDYMFKINDEEFKRIYEVICNKNNQKAHLSLNNIGHYGEDKRNVLYVTKPTTFIGMNLQQFLKESYLQNSNSNIKKEDLLEIVNYYNDKLYGYTKKEELEENSLKRIRNN